METPEKVKVESFRTVDEIPNPEITKEVKTFRTSFPCKCGGEFIFDGDILRVSDKTVFGHKCSGCSKPIGLEKQYPFIVYQ